MGAPFDTSADLWSLGCIVRFIFAYLIIYFDYNNYLDIQLYELLSGERLFDPFFQTEELGLSIEESHLIQIIEIFGEFPRQLLAAGEYSSRWFAESGTFIPQTVPSFYLNFALQAGFE